MCISICPWSRICLFRVCLVSFPFFRFPLAILGWIDCWSFLFRSHPLYDLTNPPVPSSYRSIILCHGLNIINHVLDISMKSTHMHPSCVLLKLCYRQLYHIWTHIWHVPVPSSIITYVTSCYNPGTQKPRNDLRIMPIASTSHLSLVLLPWTLSEQVLRVIPRVWTRLFSFFFVDSLKNRWRDNWHSPSTCILLLSRFFLSSLFPHMLHLSIGIIVLP